MKKERNTNRTTNSSRQMTKRARLATRRASRRRTRTKLGVLAETLRKAAHLHQRPSEGRRLTPTQRKAKLQRLQRQRREEIMHAASLRHKTLLRKKRIAARRPKRYTYIDCLRDEVPTPTGSNGTTLYQALIVGGMTAVTVTASGVSSDGLGFFMYSRWLYPVMFSISFLVRIYIAAPLTRILGTRLIDGRLRGAGRSIASTALGTAVTAPITSALVTLLFEEADDVKGYANAYLASLSVTMPTSMLVSLFVVGPLAKLLFNNRIKPVGGLRVIKTISDHASSIARMFGF